MGNSSLAVVPPSPESLDRRIGAGLHPRQVPAELAQPGLHRGTERDLEPLHRRGVVDHDPLEGVEMHPERVGEHRLDRAAGAEVSASTASDDRIVEERRRQAALFLYFRRALAPRASINLNRRPLEWINRPIGR